MRWLFLLALLAPALGLDDIARKGLEISKAPSAPRPAAGSGGGSWWPFSGKKTDLGPELMEAAKDGHLSRVKAAIEKGAPVNWEDFVSVPACVCQASLSNYLELIV